MKNLSIFVDESGDFGDYQAHSPYYIVTMVIHEQDKDIASNINKLNSALQFFNLQDDAIHTAPLIRREEIYANMSPNARRRIFSLLYQFVLYCDIRYKTFIFSKKEYDSVLKLQGAMGREMDLFFKDNLAYFQSFSEVILYYDNGQHELNRLLNVLLATNFSSYEVRKVMPNEYKLFQVADLICTVELLNCKMQTQEFTQSEKLIFHTKRDFKKDFLRGIRLKAFK
ncbi:MAG: DUF3800 domain-containing protein [Treponema sp.]|nr:DUF3800 domain-containing protein [Treponema sp.]